MNSMQKTISTHNQVGILGSQNCDKTALQNYSVCIVATRTLRKVLHELSRDI